MQETKAALQKAHSSRIKHAFNALVEIRKKFMKTSDDVKFLIEGKLVERILFLLQTRHSLDEQYRAKVIDISVSILGNLCMEDAARKRVLKVKGTPIVLLLFEESESEKIQNRVCRCLANLLLDPSNWKLVCISLVIEKIVKLLAGTKEEEFKLTCIRAIRLLGQTQSSVAQLVEKNALGTVLKLIDCDSEPVRQSAFRCVHSLAIHSCSSQFASEVLASGKLPHLLDLNKEKNHDAFQLIIRMLEHHNFRAEFGNCGGITLYHDQFLSEDADYDSWKADLLSGLSFCCKEVVNRVKLRDEGVLPSFLHSLEDEKFSALHDRIISALVCFLYDEASFAVLLENKLVPILVKHLKKYLVDVEVQEEGKVGIKSGVKTSDISASSEKLVTTETVADSAIIPSNSRSIDTESEENDTGHNDSVFEVTKECISRSKPVYRIDSPTYKTDIQWEVNEETGAKCIQRFTPPHKTDLHDGKTYSPLSVSSYYSPSSGSPEYSPPTSPGAIHNSAGTSQQHLSESRGTSLKYFEGTSQLSMNKILMTGSQTPETLHPKYPKYTGISCQLYKTPENANPESRDGVSPDEMARTCSFKGSDNYSPGAMSPESVLLEESEDPLDSGNSSDSADDTTGCVVLKTSENAIIIEREQNRGEEDHGKTNDQKCKGLELNENKTDRDDSFVKTEDEFAKKFKHHVEKLQKSFEVKVTSTKKEKKRKRSVSDSSILVLLSRVSQMTDPSTHLVTSDVIGCLIDYMSKIETPLARCPRLLSRVFRNPNSFQKILSLNIPQLIYQKLLRYENIPYLSKSLKIHQKRKSTSLSFRKTEENNEDEENMDRFSAASDDSFEEEQAAKRRRLSSDTEEQVQPTSAQKLRHKTEESICDTGRSGLAFLEDLCGIADSSYGRGTVERLMHSVNDDQKVDISINMLFISWTHSSRKHYFYQREILDNVWDVLKPSVAFSEERFVSAIEGVRLLSQVVDTRTMYQAPLKTFTSHQNTKRNSEIISFTKTENNEKSTAGTEVLGKFVETVVLPESKTCHLEHVPLDVAFQIQDQKIQANRATLAAKSEIFSAMLHGKFSEAKLTEIPLPSTCTAAFESLVHHLHGCNLDGCELLENMFSDFVDEKKASECIELLNECDKYNITDLYDDAYRYLSDKCITLDTSFSVFKYAVLCRDEKVMKACVSCILHDSESPEVTVKYVCKCLLSEYGEIFLQTISDILID